MRTLMRALMHLPSETLALRDVTYVSSYRVSGFVAQFPQRCYWCYWCFIRFMVTWAPAGP